MASPADPIRTPRPRKLGILLALVLGVFAGLFLAIVIGRSAGLTFSGSLWSAITHRDTRIDVSQPTVVHQIQQLQRLETVVYTMDKIVSGEHENPMLPDFLAGDRLLLLVHGEVVAGINFGALKSGDIQVAAKYIRLRLPKPELFSTRLHSGKTRVYSRKTGLLVPVDPDLETQVRQEAERQLRDSALKDGILHGAEENARATITGLVKGLGFEKVEFD